MVGKYLQSFWLKAAKNVENATKCQEICLITEKCKSFVYTIDKKKCILKSKTARNAVDLKKDANKIYGPKQCIGRFDINSLVK